MRRFRVQVTRVGVPPISSHSWSWCGSSPASRYSPARSTVRTATIRAVRAEADHGAVPAGVHRSHPGGEHVADLLAGAAGRWSTPTAGAHRRSSAARPESAGPPRSARCADRGGPGAAPARRCLYPAGRGRTLAGTRARSLPRPPGPRPSRSTASTRPAGSTPAGVRPARASFRACTGVGSCPTP